jgi:hypothetical protein
MKHYAMDKQLRQRAYKRKEKTRYMGWIPRTTNCNSNLLNVYNNRQPGNLTQFAEAISTSQFNLLYFYQIPKNTKIDAQDNNLCQIKDAQ